MRVDFRDTQNQIKPNPADSGGEGERQKDGQSQEREADEFRADESIKAERSGAEEMVGTKNSGR